MDGWVGVRMCEWVGCEWVGVCVGGFVCKWVDGWMDE